MPATQRGHAYRLGPNRWGLRYRDAAGQKHRKSPFPSKSAALAALPRRDRAACCSASRSAMPDLTLAEFVGRCTFERHAANVTAQDDRHLARTARPRADRVR